MKSCDLSPLRVAPIRPRSATSLLWLCGALALAGCSQDVTRAIGLTRDAPDEFRVTTRAPLSMPPDFDIRPPRPGAPRPQEKSQAGPAEEALVPEQVLNAPAASAMTPGQQALVNAAGPPAPPNIRRQVDAEAQMERPDQSFTDRLMFWKPTPLPGTVVDPQKEAQRLRENAALGQSPEAGDTPIIQRNAPKSFLDSLF